LMIVFEAPEMEWASDLLSDVMRQLELE
jgi:hypothetical protein